MAEIRQAIPTISQLKYTVRPADRWDPTGYQTQDGFQVMRQSKDYPGIQAVIVPYFGNIPMPPEIVEFRSKKFLQDGLDSLKEIKNPGQDVTDAISRLEDSLGSESEVWLEDVLAVAGIEDLEAAFAQAYSDALDEFPQLSEPSQEQSFNGIPYHQGLVQWDARLPWKGEKAIVIKTGFYKTEDMTGESTIEEVKFESGEAKRTREKMIEDLTSQIQSDNDTIQKIERVIELKAMEQTPEVTNELSDLPVHFVNDTNINDTLKSVIAHRDDAANRKGQLEAVTYGDLGDFLQNESVGSIAMNLTGAIFATKKASDPRWANLDLQAVLNRYAIPDVT